MAGAARTDPIRNFKFQVNITKNLGRGNTPLLARAGFMSVSGLGTQTEVIPYREGGFNTTTHKLPGQSDFPPIQLQRGVFDRVDGKEGHAFWEWMKELFYYQQGSGLGPVGNQFRTDFTIRVLGHPVTQGQGSGSTNPQDFTANAARVAWKVYNAWPQSVSFSDLDAGGNAIMVEQVVLVHEGIEPKFASSVGGLTTGLGFGYA